MANCRQAWTYSDYCCLPKQYLSPFLSFHIGHLALRQAMTISGELDRLYLPLVLCLSLRLCLFFSLKVVDVRL